MSSNELDLNDALLTESNSTIKRTPTIENQIQLMLEKIMDEGEIPNLSSTKYRVCLKFNDNDEETSQEEEDLNNKKYERQRRKFLTYPFIDCDQISFQQSHWYMAMKQGYSNTSSSAQGQYLDKSYSNRNANNYASNNYPSTQQQTLERQIKSSSFKMNEHNSKMSQNSSSIYFKRNDNRKKTFDSSSVQNNLSQNYKYPGVNPLQTIYTHCNTPTPPMNVNTPPLVQASSNYKMQMEIWLYNLNIKLVQANQIDYEIYSSIKSNFLSILKTHKGSRIFQNYLQNTTAEIIHQIFLGVLPHINTIISDPYANYFCKRFYTHLQIKDRIELLRNIQPFIVKYSIDSIGTYPIQGFVEDSTTVLEQVIIINSISSSIQQFCFDTYGAHVIEKIIACFNEDKIKFIFEFIMNNFISLSNNSNGICIIKKLLIIKGKSGLYERIKKIIIDNAWTFVQHPYANYIIQVIAEHWKEEEKRQIINWFKSKYVVLSMKKYSSNAVESCIKTSTETLNEYIDEICLSGRIAEVMKNNYGNYVVQKALKISDGLSKVMLVKHVEENIFKWLDKN